MFFGGHSTLPEHPIAVCRPFCEVDFAEGSSAIFRIEFFYSFNVEVQGLDASAACRQPSAT